MPLEASPFTFSMSIFFLSSVTVSLYSLYSPSGSFASAAVVEDEPSDDWALAEVEVPAACFEWSEESEPPRGRSITTTRIMTMSRARAAPIMPSSLPLNAPFFLGSESAGWVFCCSC